MSAPPTSTTKKLVNMLRPQASAEGSTAAPGVKMKGEFQSFLDNGTSFEGKITLVGLVRLDGHFKGEVDADGLVIGESGRVEAKLSVRSLVIHGSVTGEVTAKERIEVGPTGSIDASVNTPKLKVAEGARVNGSLSMGESARQR